MRGNAAAAGASAAAGGGGDGCNNWCHLVIVGGLGVNSMNWTQINYNNDIPIVMIITGLH